MDKEATREINERRARSITAKIGIIAAYFHRARNGKSLPPVRDDLTEAEHFLYLINGEPQPKEAADTLDVAFVLHADHGMNASTFSARVTISTLSDFYSAITSAIGTLKGPLHGGANEGVIHMLEEIGSETKSTPTRAATGGEEKDHGHRASRLQDARPARAAFAADGGEAERETGRSESGFGCRSGSRS
jgi:citrate synthase